MARTLRDAIESLLADISRVTGHPAETAHSTARAVAAALDYAVLDAVTGDSKAFTATMTARLDKLIAHDLTGADR